jgi:hypothetical protein
MAYRRGRMKLRRSPLPCRVGICLLALAFALTACDKAPPATESAPPAPKNATADLVAASRQSKHFEAVNRQLELGGPVYTYLDIDGDMAILADRMKSMLASLPNAPAPVAAIFQQDFARLFTTLGLTDVKALGFSSAPDTAGGFSNRMYLYLPDGRHGLLAGLGGPAAPFTHTQLAPADTAMYMETEFDVPAVYSAIKDAVQQVAGATGVNAMEAGLNAGVDEIGVAGLDVIKNLKGRAVAFARFDEKKTMTIPIPATSPGTGSTMVIPAFSALIRIDGLGTGVEAALAKLPPDMFTVSTVGVLKLYVWKGPLPIEIEGLQPVLAIEGGTLWLATSAEFLTECRDRKSGLDQDPAFQQALALVGDKGNSLSFGSTRILDLIRRLPEMNPKLDPNSAKFIDLMVKQAAALNQPEISVAANLPDGILVRSHSNHSLKAQLAAAPLGAVVGLAAGVVGFMQATSQMRGPGSTFTSNGEFGVAPPGLAGLPTGPRIRVQVMTIRNSAAAFIRNRHNNLGTDLMAVEQAAAALPANGSSPSPDQISALQAAFDAAIQRATAISTRPSETGAAQAQAAQIAASLTALKATIGPPTPAN